MDIREKAASISTVLNVTLTVAKFVLYGATGSLAILAEAWHSFSDIATSALTYLAVRRTVRQERAQPAEETAPDSGGEQNTHPGQTDAVVDENPESEAHRPLPSAEQVASLIISTIILIAGLTVVSKVVWYEPVTISRPLLAGVLFLVFAVGSYLIHRLEIDVGHRTGSSGPRGTGPLSEKSGILCRHGGWIPSFNPSPWTSRYRKNGLWNWISGRDSRRSTACRDLDPPRSRGSYPT